MKKLFVGIVIGLAVGGFAVWTVLRHNASDVPKAAAKEEKKEDSPVQHGTNGETFLKLDAKAQTRMGLKTAALAAIEIEPEIKAYGKVLDSTPLATLLAELATTRSSLEVSRGEFERVKVLQAQGNASPRLLEAAKAALDKDSLLLDAAQMRLGLGWGPLAGHPKLASIVQSLARQQAALVRFDLPLGSLIKTPPLGVRLGLAGGEENFVAAEFLGAAPTADPQTQGQGFLFLLPANPPPVNAALAGWLKFGGEKESGVLVPRAALLRHGGEVFVYVQTGDDTFERREVELVRLLVDGWFVDEGLKPGMKLVVEGAQQLLSEELKGKGD